MYNYNYRYECCKNCTNNPKNNPFASGICACTQPYREMVTWGKSTSYGTTVIPATSTYIASRYTSNK